MSEINVTKTPDGLTVVCNRSENKVFVPYTKSPGQWCIRELEPGASFEEQVGQKMLGGVCHSFEEAAKAVDEHKRGPQNQGPIEGPPGHGPIPPPSRK